jgi:hypothetical protein
MKRKRIFRCACLSPPDTPVKEANLILHYYVVSAINVYVVTTSARLSAGSGTGASESKLFLFGALLVQGDSVPPAASSSGII